MEISCLSIFSWLYSGLRRHWQTYEIFMKVASNEEEWESLEWLFWDNFICEEIIIA